MGEWEYTLGQAISWDECYFVPRYPRHVAQAFLAVSYDDDETLTEKDIPVPYQRRVEEAIQNFARRWGGLNDSVFVRVLQEAKGRDRLAAIFAIGSNSAMANVTALVLLEPLLRSTSQLERCAAACMFALRRDKRAIPVLEEYLIHEPSEDAQGRSTHTTDASVWYASERCRIARLLASWGPPSIVPVLRQSFLHLLELEGPNGGNVYDQETQDALCYALGRRGALSTFHGVELPPQRRRIAMIYLALGFVQADERFERLYDAVLLDRELQRELVEVLMKHFALSEEESKQAICEYPADTERRRHATYGIGEQDETPLVVAGGNTLEAARKAIQAQGRNRTASSEEAEQ